MLPKLKLPVGRSVYGCFRRVQPTVFNPHNDGFRSRLGVRTESSNSVFFIAKRSRIFVQKQL